MSEETKSPVQGRKQVELIGGPPWGFRIQGGKDSNISLKVARVNPGSKAAKYGVRDGDLISSINGQPTEELTNVEVQKLIKRSGDRVTLELKSSGKRMGIPDGSSSLAPVSSGNDQTVAATSLSTSQLASSGAPAVLDESNITTATSAPSVTTASTSTGATKSEKKEKKKSDKSKKKSSQSPSKSEEGKDKSKKSGKHHHQQQQQQQQPTATPNSQQHQQQQPDPVDKANSALPVDDFAGEGGGGGGVGDDDGMGYGKAKHMSQNALKTSSLDTNNGKQKQASNDSASNANGAKSRKGNGMITGTPSSLLGDIIAELDDLLDADFFNVATNSSDNFNEKGVWAPGSTTAEVQQPASPPKQPVNNVASSSCTDLPNLEEGASIPPVWTPPNTTSPSSQKKFRPVNFNVPGSPKSSTPRTLSLDRSNSSPQLPTRQPQQQSQQPPLQASASLTDQNLLSQHKEIVSSPEQNDNSSRSDSVYQTSSASISVTQNQNSSSQSTVSLPKYQSPTVTLLQKAREGQLPKGAHYLEKQHSSPGRRTVSNLENSVPRNNSSAVGLTLDLESQNITGHELNGRRVTEGGALEFEGIGPITPEGVPIATKPAIRTEQQHQWYKRMYESLHVERPQRRDFMTVKYKRKGPRQPIGHSAGHYSEPEVTGYESDTYAYKYATLDRRKLRDRYSESTDCFSPSPSTPNSILSPTASCPPSGVRFTPGRIEDYTPGNSCVIAKEIRKHKPTLQWALGSRDLGYESDSNLIIRKRVDDDAEFRGIKSPPPPPLSPAEQRQLYVDIQKGGEVPLKGLRKPAPERPKESWLNLLRLRVRSMPSFGEMMKNTPSGRGRSRSPANYRSGSPVCKSPPPNSTVALLQERIQEKIRRSNSDLSPRPGASFRSRYGISGVDASRIIHTVRSSNQIRRSGSSSIPVRSRETSVEKLRVSSPELLSPREVKKALQSSHRLSIKLEVVKSSPPSNAFRRGKDNGAANEGKKSGLKKAANGKHLRSTTLPTVQATSTKIKSVKISDKVSVDNNNCRTITSINNNRRSTSSVMGTNGTTNGTPVKPPRKIKAKLIDSSSIDPSSSNSAAIFGASHSAGTVGGRGKVHKVSKVSPVASRHASCLSPHTSRPTSPGSGLSSAIPISSNNSTGGMTKSGSTCEKVMGSSGRLAGGGGTAVLESQGIRNPGVTKKVGGSSISEGTSATSAAGAANMLGSSFATSAARKLIREGGERKQGNGTNRIILSCGKDDRKSPEKEKQPLAAITTTTAKLTKAPTTTAPGSSMKSKDVSLAKGSECERKRNKFDLPMTGSGGEKVERLCSLKIKSNSNIDLRDEEIIKCSRGRSFFPPERNVSFSKVEQDISRYWTIPPRKRRDGSPQQKGTVSHITSAFLDRPTSLFAFRSLPALTPYLTETKRVSQSLFLTKQQLPLVRQTKTSALREKLAHDATGMDGGGYNFSPTTTANNHAKLGKVGCSSSNAAAAKRGRIIRSVSCLTLKEKLIRDYTYTNYILELQHARKRSPRFMQLHRLYSSLERLGQLERSTSLYDIPVLSAEKQLDFEAWWKVRNRLRVEEEMSSIVNQLMHAQRNREFFFRPKSPEATRWRGDSALRCKQWNIDELRHFLLTGELLKSRQASASDLHKTAWRGTSVKEVALNMEVASLSKADYYFYRDKAAEYSRMPALRRAFSMSSTLSDDQKEKIKSRLGTLIVKREKGKDEPSSSEGKGGYSTVTVITSRMGLNPPSSSSPVDCDTVVGVDGSLTETAKRQLSKTLSEEFQERKMKERESIIRIVEGSSSTAPSGKNNNGNVKSSGESESDSSIKTVIHIPVSTKMLLRKCHEQQQNTKGKTPVYSVYCTQGVPSKVSFFETFHKDSNNNKEPIVISPSEAKIVKTKSYSERLNAKESRGGHNVSAAATTVANPSNDSCSLGRAKSPVSKQISKSLPTSSSKSEIQEKRSRSVTPEKRYDNRYMSHINVISKLASLLLKKDNALKTLVQREVLERDKLERLRLVNAGEVDRLKQYFEDHIDDEHDLSFHPEVSLLRCLFCSDPNLARLTDKFQLGSSSEHARRCASADIFKEKLEYYEGRDRDRIRPDGKESSPVHSRSPELYFSSRSRRPIYQPSSTPNICQPTLTAHCFLESPTKSMEFDTSCYSSDFSGNYWDYRSASPAFSSTTAATTAYSPQPRTPIASMAAVAPVALSSDPNPKSNREMSYSSVPPRILESRVPPPIATSTPINTTLNKAGGMNAGSLGHEIGKNWNFDPSIHQPKYRYVPQPPIIEPRQYYCSSGHYSRSHSSLIQPGSLPPILPPPPIPPPPVNYQQPGRLTKSESFHASSSTSQVAPQLYRSVRHWNPNVRGQSARGEYHHYQEQPATIPGPNVGLPLQRSASLNYAHQKQRGATPVTLYNNSSQNIHSRIATTTTSSTTTSAIGAHTASSTSAADIDDQIIQSQYDGNNENNRRHQDEALKSVPNNIIREDATGVSVVSNAVDAAAAGRMLQIENASSTSPVRYAESEVNIHYKAPVRFVEKEFIGEEELRRRQEIAMRRFYEEQRQRKFLQEIQDMENRRHMDNFTPSQKSPIPLNRYDDVIDELPKGRWREKTPESKQAARALYNFVAQNSRELSFRKGDILFIRKKVDSNWYEGEHNAAVGIFPCSYVEAIPSTSAYNTERVAPRTVTEGQAKVRFNFTAATPAEMSIIKGETVVLTRRVDTNWYEGRIGSRRGIFPTSYVHVLREPGSSLDLTTGSSKSPKPIGAPAAHSLVTQNGGGMYNAARHNYKPNEYSLGTDLSNIDAFINAHSSVLSSSPGQYQYRKENVFQQNQQQLDTSRSQTDPGRNRYAQNLTIDTRIEPIPYRAVYNYKPAHEDELELRDGDVVHVLEKCDDGWFVGTSQRTGLFGTFPGNYVERLY